MCIRDEHRSRLPELELKDVGTSIKQFQLDFAAGIFIALS